MKNVEIELSWHELICAAYIGVRRNITSLQKNREDQHLGPSDWNVHIEAAASELAFAKHMGVYCIPGVNTFKAPDVIVGEVGYQVRSTKYPDGHLIIRPRDSEDEPYILTTVHALCVKGELPRVTLVAMLKQGGMAKRDCYKNREGDSWWVPQAHLIDLPEQLI